MDWKGNAEEIVTYWLGWQVLDWLRLAAFGAAVTGVGWLLARYRESASQRELRGAMVTLAILTVILALSLSRAAITSPAKPQASGSSVASVEPHPLDDSSKWKLAHQLRKDGGAISVVKSEIIPNENSTRKAR